MYEGEVFVVDECESFVELFGELGGEVGYGDLWVSGWCVVN